MTAFAEYMNQTATYWSPGVNDGFGNQDFSAVVPVKIMCRWQDDAVLFRAPDGSEQTSSAIVYPDRELELRGFLVKGDETGATIDHPKDLAGAFEIRQVGSSPSLDADQILYKAYL